MFCTLCTQQMWSTLTAFSTFCAIMESFEDILHYRKQHEIYNRCHLLALIH